MTFVSISHVIEGTIRVAHGIDFMDANDVAIAAVTC
jgi:hypothetical protein